MKEKQNEIVNKQLELERAENQQLRNLLQHKKDEMSAMEIYYLKRESGQRREREEEFKVKEEPKEDDEEKPIQDKKIKTTRNLKNKIIVFKMKHFFLLSEEFATE